MRKVANGEYISSSSSKKNANLDYAFEIGCKDLRDKELPT